MKDIDGNTYPIVKICNQTWTAKNLNVSKYRNGDVIPQVQDPRQWERLTTGAWCYYNNDPANGSIYGKFYNWYAVNDPRGLAPQGWHIPKDAEWTILTDCLGMSVSGGKMKSTGFQYWKSPNTDATNSSGFSGLPGGIYTTGGAYSNLIGEYGYWWSSTNLIGGGTLALTLSYNSGLSGKDIISLNYGLSVRLVKD